MILFRDELKTSLLQNIPLDRFEHGGVKNGTLLFYRTFAVSVPSLLLTSGHLHIKHKGISVTGYGTDYPIYANARICLLSAASENQLPAIGSVSPEISLEGGNIRDTQHHYYSPNLASQKVIQSGWHRVECWAATGSDAQDVDGLGELVAYNGANTNQFNILVMRL